MTVEVLAERVAPARSRVRPADASLRLLADGVGGISLAVVVILWATGPGSAAIWTSTANALTGLGRLSGLLAADLLLIQVLLMARVPVLEASFGRDRLVRRHRVVGFTSFALIWIHIGSVTSGYSLLVGGNWASQTWDLIANYPGMLLAVAGVAATCLVAATSMRIARRRLRYASWHLLHLYAYLGVGLALPHQIWAGADFTSSPGARLYWLSLYALTLAAVLTFRVGLPAWRTLRHQITVLSVEQESPEVVTVRLAGRDLHRLPARAGQFFIWRFLDGAGWSRGHPYSLSAPPRLNQIRITAKGRGESLARLAALRPGTWVQIEGPYGRLTGERRTATTLAMFACGIGITPLRALLEDENYRPGDAVLVYRARREEDLVFRAELEALAAHRGVRIHYLVGHRTRDGSWLPAGAFEGSDADAVRHFVPSITDCDVFICGPETWSEAVRAASVAAGVPGPRVHSERFAW
ncbi:ferredoxin reductase family protein [Sporichthya polymorpha]|uniref:ferredoxin reductase family protein n=1 Tax=Sporichthya polymorpha TaxID=35751 RepID=UPI0012EBDBFC|nr:ferredoxin reductase family protein [Sporichthya polymorpha]